MTKTYLQVLKQIEGLKTQAEKLRRAEIDGVVTRIRDAIRHYGLTAGELGLSSTASSSGSSGAGPVARKKPGPKPGSTRLKKKKGGTGKVAPKYRDENGNTWAGRGQRPIWLRNALATGRKIEDYAIK